MSDLDGLAAAAFAYAVAGCEDMPDDAGRSIAREESPAAEDATDNARRCK